ncbi:MAG: NAD(+) diphosphatase [Nesterenkonia sp.]|uniref:NAD(+) diphosphatase n=1 Tax=Nesterenkonia marinintestina TaxID=2979865 RepID=UPI0021BE492D|nr:NAD(+) diphosphatase [Nesterenkonia sp. GX14115]MDO5493374.1 NAD(+) diphosphatase [Nesterenkonia sp.]
MPTPDPQAAQPDRPGPLELPLADAGLHRQDQQRQRPDWLDHVWSLRDTRVLSLRDGLAPTCDHRLVLTPAAGPLPETAVYLGSFREDSGHLVAVSLSGSPQGAAAEAEMPLSAETPPAHAADGDHLEGPAADAEWLDLRDVGHRLGALDAALLTQAVAVTTWHRSSPHCTRCGHRTEVRSSGWMRRCPHCGTETFPRTDPAAITAVVDDAGRILLGSAYRWAAHRYSTFAGFVEAGESVEAAVVREVAEEAGVEVDDVRYLGSQAWPFPRSLMLGYLARTSRPEQARADREEIRDVRWFTREELRDEVASGRLWIPSRSSISRALIEHWYGGPMPDAEEEPAG